MSRGKNTATKILFIPQQVEEHLLQRQYAAEEALDEGAQEADDKVEASARAVTKQTDESIGASTATSVRIEKATEHIEELVRQVGFLMQQVILPKIQSKVSDCPVKLGICLGPHPNRGRNFHKKLANITHSRKLLLDNIWGGHAAQCVHIPHPPCFRA